MTAPGAPRVLLACLGLPPTPPSPSPARPPPVLLPLGGPRLLPRGVFLGPHRRVPSSHRPYAGVCTAPGASATPGGSGVQRTLRRNLEGRGCSCAGTAGVNRRAGLDSYPNGIRDLDAIFVIWRGGGGGGLRPPVRSLRARSASGGPRPGARGGPGRGSGGRAGGRTARW